MSEPVCNRCGRCCHYQIDGVWKKCKNLVYIGNRSSCRIWKSPRRMLDPIDVGPDGRRVFCTTMDQIPFSYVGCPYNAGKPLQLVQIRRYDGEGPAHRREI